MSYPSLDLDWGMRIVLSALALLAMTFAAAAMQQPPDVCKMFAESDIAAVLGAGSSSGSRMVAGTCVWTAKGLSLTIARMDASAPAEAVGVVDVSKMRAQKGDIVKDEAGVGQRAVSTVSANHRGLSLVAADGKTVWSFTMDSGDQAIDAATALPKLRDLLKKGLAAK
jgi:hypothetical protein